MILLIKNLKYRKCCSACIVAPMKLRQEDYEFKASLGYTETNTLPAEKPRNTASLSVSVF